MYKALMIGAHNDEIEYSLGGLSCLLRDAGVAVRHVIVASKFYPEIDQATRERYIAQEDAAARVLDVEKKIISNRDANTYIESMQAVDQLIAEILEYKPDLIFIHWPEDNHLEHRSVARVSYHALQVAGFRGARAKEVYAFESGVNQTMDYFRPDFAINISDVMDRVDKSLLAYDSFSADGPGLVKEKHAATTFRGQQSGMEHAETLKIIKFPNGGDDFILRQLMKDRFRWVGGSYAAYGYHYF